MADYFPVLSRAVAGLETNTGEARRAVYDRARAAIVRQLRAIEPPLAEEDISRERMQLEEAIRRVEAGAGGGSASAAPKPSQPALPAKPAPSPSAATPQPARPAAERPGAGANAGPAPAAASPAIAPSAKPSPAKPAPDKPAPDAQSSGRTQDGRPRAAGAAGAARPRPATRPDGRPIIQAAGEPRASSGTKRSGPMVALGLLAVVLIGVGAFAARGPISSLFGGGAPSETAETAPPKDDAGAAKPADEPKPDAAAENKSGDRLPQDAASAEPSAPDAPIVGGGPGPQDTPSGQTPPPAEQEVARGPDPTAPAPPAETAPPAQPPVETPAPQPPEAAQTAPLVAQRAVLYEEGPNQQSGEALQGTIVWRTESVSAGQNQPLETALRGEIDIPARKLRATLTIRRNVDPTLPASHTIEIQFTLPDDFPNAGISNVPGVLMKADESARGSAVAGLSVRVTNGFFLIGLSNLDAERTVNEQLLRDRGWIDVPILYDNGRRAVLTLEKGTPGSQAFQDAFTAWRSASAANPAPGASP